MKGFKKILSLILSLALILCFPISASAKATSKTIFNSHTYTHQSQFNHCKILEGVDLSKHNGSVNFASMKKAGVKYVILRAGYRGYGSKGSLSKDSKFDEYIKAAAAQGLDIGVYFYSQAINENEAITEANYTLNIINKYRSSITLPVAFDYEFADVSSGRFDSAWRNRKLDKTKCTNIARAFCEQIEKNGYGAMIYANKSFLSETIDGKSLGEDYPIWLAHYTTNTNYSGNFYIWQFSSTGHISGVSGYVDSNFLYKNDVFTAEEIEDQAYSRKAIRPSPIIKYDGDILKKGSDYTLSYTNNVNIGTASITVKGAGDYKNVPSARINFKIVPAKASSPVLTAQDNDAVELKWDEEEDVDGYRISYLKQNVPVQLLRTTSTEARLNNLDSAREYEIVVQAYKTVNKRNYDGIASDKLKVVTKPAQVTGVKTTSRSTNYLKLTWKRQSGADKYIVYKYNYQTKKYYTYKEIRGGHNNSVKVSGLSANTKYKFKVKAVKYDESGKALNGKNSSAFTDYTSPSKPKLNSAKAKSKRRIVVNHTKTSGASGYQVKWSTYKNFNRNTKTKSFSGKSKTSNTITAARSHSKYYVKVRSYKTRNGKRYYSPWSNVKSVKTK